MNYEWQQEAIQLLKDESFTILTAPTGAGKSRVYASIIPYVIREYGYRVIVAVPQTPISKGFRNLFEIDGQTIIDPEFDIIDLTQDSVSKGQQLRSFLHHGTGLAITTHSLLGGEWRYIRRTRRKGSLRKLALYIDEAHHVAGIAEDDVKIRKKLDGVRNQLGNVLQDALLVSEQEKTDVGLLSATFFRSQGLLMSFGLMEDFVIYRRDPVEHIKSLKLKELKFEIKAYESGKSIETACQWILEERKKYREPIRAILRVARYGGHPRGQVRAEKLMRRIKRRLPGLKILDALTDANQKDTRTLLRRSDEPDKAAELDSYDVLVGCDMLDEGLDWPAINRIANVRIDRSPVKLIHVPGRALRSHPDKKTVKIATFAPKNDDLGEQQDQFEDHVIAKVVLFVLGEIFYGRPLTIPAVSTSGEELEKEVSLFEVFGDTDVGMKVLYECAERIEARNIIKNHEARIDFIKSHIDGLPIAHGIKVSTDDLVEMVNREVTRFRASMKAIERRGGTRGIQEDGEESDSSIELSISDKMLQKCIEDARDIVDQDDWVSERVITKNLTEKQLSSLVTNTAKFEQQVKDVCTWMNHNRRQPKSNGRNLEEKRLSSTLNKLRRWAKGLTPQRGCFPELFFCIAKEYGYPELFQPQIHIENKTLRLRKIEKQCRVHGHKPSWKENDGDCQFIKGCLKRRHHLLSREDRMLIQKINSYPTKQNTVYCNEQIQIIKSVWLPYLKQHKTLPPIRQARIIDRLRCRRVLLYPLLEKEFKKHKIEGKTLFDMVFHNGKYKPRRPGENM